MKRHLLQTQTWKQNQFHKQTHFWKWIPLSTDGKISFNSSMHYDCVQKMKKLFKNFNQNELQIGQN